MEYKISYREKDKGIQVIIQYKNKDGIWKQRTKQGFKKQSLAKIAADKLLDEIKENFNFCEHFSRMTVGELKEQYLDHIKIHREFYTYNNYKSCFKRYKSLEKIEMSNLKLIDIQKCVNEMVKDNLSSGTLERWTVVFKQFLKWCEVNYEIKVPNCSRLTLPIAKVKKERKALNSKELDELIDYFENRIDRSLDYYICVVIASKAGLRVGEIAGLTWNDIDFINDRISVNKQWKRDKNNKYGFGELKGKNSYRLVPIPNSLTISLKDIYTNGDYLINDRLLFSSSTSSLSVNLDRVLKRHFDITIHNLRHTYATNLVSKGLNFKTTASILGHDVEQTMRVYSHVTDEMFKSAEDFIKNNLN